MQDILTCSKCKQSKARSEFTSLNRNKANTRGLCKTCKSERDAVCNAKRDQVQGELTYFDLIPDSLSRKTQRARIGVLIMDNITDRENVKGFFQQSNFGLMSILDELNEPYEFTRAELMNAYEFVLVSLTSVMDVENLIYTMECFSPVSIKPKIIIGGFGCINIKLIVQYIDIAIFGRGEGQINDVIFGARYTNVWRKEDDELLTGHYKLRQPQYLVKGENSVGCRGRCRYCQYTWTRKALQEDQKYDPGQSLHIQETDWRGLTIEKTGRYTTAWDGWSEYSRLRVAKPITDQCIKDKLIEIGNNKSITASVYLKVFQIVGYPWETIASVNADIASAAAMLQDIDGQIVNKIVIAFMCTPFGPEPLTPMQYDAGNIYINWREEMNGPRVYDGEHISAFVLPVTSGPFTLLKRMMINRAEISDLETFKKIAFNKRLRNMPERWKVPYLIEHKVIDETMFGEVDSAGFDYLSV